jgi:aspartyl-tRNA(Asn)/glutamyl-tRNA(Gln) amidotransferase subunit C
MAAPINKNTLKQLAELARLKLTTKESDEQLKDLKKILKYFEELQEVDTEGVEPMNGGTLLKNIFRDDSINLEQKAQSVDDTGRIIESFPETDKGYLKVPKIL